MKISIIAAVAKNGIIGKTNALPWHLPADLKRFKELTTGKPIIMGRKTYESIGRPLPNRTNIVITSDKNLKIEGCVVVGSPDEAIEAAKGAEEVMIIGGGEIYRQFLPKVSRMYLTEVDTEIEGDVFFPEFDRSEWREVFREEHAPDEKNKYPYTFLTLEKK